MDVPSLTIPQLREKFASGALKPRDAVDQLAQRIAAVDPQLKAYNYLNLDTARAQADAANVALPLGGVPIAIKDVINVQGDP
jgi:aspartyl-tRNA(Asn)/glutamyl-tRNA(Gln) amidotransferase subunit A